MAYAVTDRTVCLFMVYSTCYRFVRITLYLINTVWWFVKALRHNDENLIICHIFCVTFWSRCAYFNAEKVCVGIFRYYGLNIFIMGAVWDFKNTISLLSSQTFVEKRAASTLSLVIIVLSNIARSPFV